MDDYDETEQERKEYYGEAGPSFVDGRKTKYFPMYQKQRRLQVSVAVTTGFMLIAIGAVAGVFALKSYLVNSIKMANGDTLANFVNFAQVSILKLTFDSVAKWLTEQENCKTDTMYENSLVVKLFAFNAVNAYAAVFYIAFIKVRLCRVPRSSRCRLYPLSSPRLTLLLRPFSPF
jgi:anoctamin-5